MVFIEYAMAARVIIFSLVFIAFLSINSSASQEQGNDIQFTYSGATGPGRWGTLNPAFSKCAYGKLQSPVNIVKNETVFNRNVKPLRRRYFAANATLLDSGFNIGIRSEGNAGKIVLDGKSYYLKQFHWHSPSDHRINGFQYAAELHLVHKTMDGSSIAVVAVLYKYGRADHMLAKIRYDLRELAKKTQFGHKQEAQMPIGIFNFKRLENDSRKYYRYNGSLTTPPCSENVIWLIHRKVRSISQKQVAALRAPLVSGCKRNSRPPQPLNGRPVERCDL